MTLCDTETAPDPAEWLGWKESERGVLVASLHRRAGIRLPGLQIHAATHPVVENQLAEEMLTVTETLERLKVEGFNRQQNMPSRVRFQAGGMPAAADRSHKLHPPSYGSQPASCISGTAPEDRPSRSRRTSLPAVDTL